MVDGGWFKGLALEKPRHRTHLIKVRIVEFVNDSFNQVR